MGVTATFGVDLGGTNLRVALVDPDGTIVEQRGAATPETLDGIVDTITGAVRAFAPLRPEARALGVGAAGMVDHDGVIHYSPNVPAFLKAPVRERLEAAVGLPTIVDNDANVAVVAELTHGVARGEHEVLLITLGTGVGGGIVTRGRVLRGAHGFAAEIGHFQVDPDGPLCACGERGHWEATASGTALGAMGREWVAAGRAPAVLELAGGDEAAVTGLHVGEAARAGDPVAIGLVAEYAGHVAVGLVGLANILDPALIVVSGGLIDLADVLLDPVRAAFGGRVEGAAYRPEIPIVPAALGRHAGVIGAAVLGAGADVTVKVGITLPSFRDDVDTSLAVAAAAEASGLDGVFAYDHLFRRDRAGRRRPALEMFALMGAVASATERIAVGSLVARATLRPYATLANGFDTLARILGPERLLVAIGAGDQESREENETFGLDFGTVAERVAALRDAVDETRDRGYPVWVGGSDPAVREVAAAHADGWNRWGAGLERFRAQAANLRAAAARAPFTVTWGGLVIVAEDDRAAEIKAERLGAGDHVLVGGPEVMATALRAYAEAGAEWLMVGPVDSSDPDNARILGEEILPRLR